MPASSRDYLHRELKARAGIAIGNARQTWVSSFGVQRYLAGTFTRNHVFLCGDAAHLMSPVGGQNMNTGFADAELACWLTRLVIERAIPFEQAGSLYNRVRMQAARTALRRAHYMMMAGTSGGYIWSAIRNSFLTAVFQTPLRKKLLRQFNMLSIPFRNLDHYKTVFKAELKL
ncbi:FAD-dependent monooxygenase [Geobacter chapellei]|uniref:FAD-dependent monooxygenase n=2 Tax=Pelotalea chapellei TaxID=44671 RepID=A0ABS5U9M7_9BACT|nr:FAD-dependent monooxygenase [Pelotalea chapellei]MBT1072364.1 FAD-dependent monooxygenase [Pelotalea chapellei]